MGFAELAFGTALGIPRSEFPVNETLAIMTPQIVGSAKDGDTIAGKGFTTKILASCECSTGMTSADVMKLAPHIDNTTATDLLTEFSKFKIAGMVNHIDASKADTEILITTILSKSNLCGGTEELFLPVCVTKMWEHTNAEVLVSYMTDGTPASIAVKKASIRKMLQPANQTWAAAAMLNILEKPISANALPSTIAGTLNPLLWWATPNFLTFDPSLVSAGMETMFAMILRAGIQRSYTTTGNTCIMNVPVEGETYVTMDAYSVITGVLILSFHLVITLASILCFIPWLSKHEPIGPAVRLLSEKAYFTTILNSAKISTGLHELCNAQTHQIWQNLDLLVRIGESIQTVSEEVGHVSMDRPKLIRSLVNGKRYY